MWPRLRIEDVRTIVHVLGTMVLAIAATMLIPLVVALLCGEYAAALDFLVGFGFSLTVGGGMWFVPPGKSGMTRLQALIVTGCLAQRYREEILTEIPEVDAVIGTTAQDTLVQTLQEVTGRREISGKEEKDQALVRLNDLRRIPRTDAKRVLTTANG